MHAFGPKISPAPCIQPLSHTTGGLVARGGQLFASAISFFLCFSFSLSLIFFVVHRLLPLITIIQSTCDAILNQHKSRARTQCLKSRKERQTTVSSCLGQFFPVRTFRSRPVTRELRRSNLVGEQWARLFVSTPRSSFARVDPPRSTRPPPDLCAVLTRTDRWSESRTQSVRPRP